MKTEEDILRKCLEELEELYENDFKKAFGDKKVICANYCPNEPLYWKIDKMRNWLGENGLP